MKTSTQMKTINSNVSDVQMVNYVYQGNPISFRINGQVMISATHMARPYGMSKQPVHWLKNQSTKEFLDELSKLRKISLVDLVVVRKGGINPGTWFHEDVAIEFARWLCPAFVIWCNDRVKEIALQWNTPPQIENAPYFEAEDVFNGYYGKSGKKSFGENYYLISILKAIADFLDEEFRGNAFTELRLQDKIIAAKKLFPEDRIRLWKCRA